MRDEIEGKAEEVKGKVTSDKGEEIKGKIRQTAGKARSKSREIGGDIHDHATEQREQKERDELRKSDDRQG